MKLIKIQKAVIAVLILVALVTACKEEDIVVGEGPVVTQTLAVDAFTGVNLATVANITIIQGSTQEVKAIGYANIIANIKTDVTDNVWDTELEGTNRNLNLSLEITVPNINRVVASSTGSIVIEDFVDQTALGLEASSTGSITLNRFEGITALSSVASSTGSITANSDIETLEELQLNVSSNSTFNGFPINSDDCNVTCSGNGKARIVANNSLNVNMSGNAQVFFRGNPTITQNISGNGMLIDAN